MEREYIGKQILDAAFRIHTSLGPGLLESAYESCLCYELRESGLAVVQQKALPLIYKEVKLDAGYRIDLLVENQIIVEIKSIDNLAPVHQAQILTYMRLSQISLGYLLNFNVARMKDGIKRMIL